MDLTVQEDFFNSVYSKYKTYKNFYDKEIPKMKKGREEFSKFALENQDNIEKVTDKYYEFSQKFLQHDKDLFILQTKLLNITEAYEDIIDISQDVLDEIRTFEKPFLYFEVNSNGEIEEVVTPAITKLKQEQKEMYKEQVEAFIKNMNG